MYSVRIIIVAVTLFSVSSFADNLILNPGFEYDNNPADGVPDNWTDQWASTPAKSLDSTEKHSGTYSWKFQNDGTKYSGAYSNFIQIDPNTTYRLTAWVKSQNGTEIVRFGWAEYDAGQNLLSYVSDVYWNTVSTDWVPLVTNRKPMNSNTAYVKVRIFGPYQGVGTVWWDDFNLSEATPSPTTYYVDDDPNARDFYDGLYPTYQGGYNGPWKTIQKAATTVLAGDTVNIRGGTYLEQVSPQNSGNSTNGYITYQAYENEEVIIESPGNCCILLPDSRDLSYLHFKSLTLKNADIANIEVIAGTSSIKEEIIIEDITSYNSSNSTYDKGYGIHFVDGVKNSQIINCKVYNNKMYGIYLYKDNHDILIEGNEVYGHLGSSNNGSNILISGLSGTSDQNYNINIFNNETYGAGKAGIVIWYSNNIHIKNNHCHHNGSTGIQLESLGDDPPLTQYVIVENNLCEYNSLIYAGETGIWVDDSDYVVVQNNIMRYNSIGLYISGSFNVISRYNTIYLNNSVKGYNSGGVWVVGTEQREDNWPEAGGDDVIVHNTIYKNGNGLNDLGQRAQLVIGDIWDNSVQGDSARQAHRILFKNNIATESQANLFDLDSWILGYDHELNYNNYYHSDRNFRVCWQPVGLSVRPYIIDWDTYTGSGYDSNSIFADPNCLDITAPDPNLYKFYLQEDSPCIDSGGYLTFTESSGTDANVVDANDARYFCDGYGLIDGDWIQINDDIAQVTDVNYISNRITIDRNLTWIAGDPVSYPYAGIRPDIGAYEYGVNNIQNHKWYSTIQDAIDAASDGDEIVVYPGTYYENIDFDEKALTLRSVDPNDWGIVAATIIDGGGTSTTPWMVIDVDTPVNKQSFISGLTIQNDQYGIWAQNTCVTVERCIIKDCLNYGIRLNDQSSHDDYRYIVESNKIFSNSTGLVTVNAYTKAKIRNNWMYENTTQGIYWSNGTGEVTGNTIVGNHSYGINYIAGNPIITNNILWDNFDDLSGCTATYSCIEDGDSGTGNISSDPNFVDPENGDYHIISTSPCIDVGDNSSVDSGDTDIDGDVRIIDDGGDPNAIVDMGADEYNPEESID